MDWLVEEGDVKDRDEAVEFGKKLVKTNIIRHGKKCHVNFRVSCCHGFLLVFMVVKLIDPRSAKW